MDNRKPPAVLDLSDKGFLRVYATSGGHSQSTASPRNCRS
nr:MAG TPA: hypothetical protein [Caudoviricetes sp.]